MWLFIVRRKKKQQIHMISWCWIELTGWMDKHISDARSFSRLVVWLSSEHDIAYYMRIMNFNVHIPIFHTYGLKAEAKAKAKKTIQIIIFLPPLWFHYHKILSIKKHARTNRSNPFVKHRQMNGKKSAGKCVGRSKSEMGTLNLLKSAQCSNQSHFICYFFSALKN